MSPMQLRHDISCVAPEGHGEPARMIGHGLRAAGIGGGCCRGDAGLRGQPDHERLGRLLRVREHGAWMAQQGKLHGEAKPAGVAETLGDEMAVGSGQGEQTRQAVCILRYSQQDLAGLRRSKSVGASKLPPSTKPPSWPWTVMLWET